MMKVEGFAEGRFLQVRDKCGTHQSPELELRRLDAGALRIPHFQLYLEHRSSFRVQDR